jgi:hypothetical protein
VCLVWAALVLLTVRAQGFFAVLLLLVSAGAVWSVLGGLPVFGGVDRLVFFVLVLVLL